MAGGLPELSLKEKVLLWLGHVEAKGDDAPGIHCTQAGIATATGMSRGHVSRTVTPLLEMGLLAERDERVAGFSRALKGYRLTPSGREELRNIEASLGHALVETRRAGAQPQPERLGQALREVRPARTLWEAVSQVLAQGHLELEAAAPAPALRPRFLADLTDAPPERPFVGRERETLALRVWLDSPSRVYLLEAPGGLGKTTFVAHAVRTGRARTHCLWVSVTEWTTPRALLDRVDQMLAELGRPGTSPDGVPPATLADHLRPRFKGFPLLLVLDDVQKASPPVLSVLQVLARLAHTEAGPRLILVGRFVDLPGDVFRDARVERLPPLSNAEADVLLAGAGVLPGQRPALIATCRGNPLFLQLLARTPDASSGTTDFARYLSRDLAATLDPARREFLHCVSCLRVAAPVSLFQRLGVGSPRVIDELAQASLVAVRTDGQVEMHDIVRDAFYRQLDFRERARLHGRLAEAYRPRAEDMAGVTEYLHHLVQAGDREEAVRWVLRNQTRLMARAHELFTRPRP